MPAKAMSDIRLSALELRALMVIAWHDGMSGTSKGKGMGCYAKYTTLAETINTDITNFSKAKGKLLSLGYIVEEPQMIDKRRNTLRVVYDETDTYLVGETANNKSEIVGENTNKQHKIVGEATNYLGKVVGDGEGENGSFSSDSGLHYSSLREEQNSDESRKKIPLSGATHSRDAALSKDLELSAKIDGKPWETQLVIIEREIVKGGESFCYDLTQWAAYAWSIHEASDELHIMGQAERIHAAIDDLIPY